MLLQKFILLVVMARTTTAIISAGSVLMKPCGVLEMEVSWVDSPKDGSYYHMYLLTTIQATGAVQLHRQNNFRFNGTSFSYRIGEYNKHLFFAGNAQTSGNFPGFRLNNQYRIYIAYFNANNVGLNQAGGQTEMSLHASPMTKASPPQNVRSCEILDVSTSPCHTLAVVSRGFKVYWDRQASVGYDTYFPPNAYGVEYYRVEVSEDPLNFQTLVGRVTCVLGQSDSVCKYDRRIALVRELPAGRVYYYRVLAGTIIGDGEYSSTLTSPTIPDSVICPVNTQCSSCMLIDDCVCKAGYYGNHRDNCMACETGKYKQSVGFGSCVSCPGNTTTISTASVRVSDCVCPFGTYIESVSLQTCASCPGNTSTFRFGSVSVSDCSCAIGTYVESISLQTCTSCPENTTTLSSGSLSISDCVCVMGYAWNESYSLRRLLEKNP